MNSFLFPKLSNVWSNLIFFTIHHFLLMIFLESRIGPLRIVSSQHIDSKIVCSLIKLFIFLVVGRFVDPNCHNFTIIMHHLDEWWSDMHYLEVTSLSLLIMWGNHFIGMLQRNMVLETLKVDCIHLGLVIFILQFKFPHCLMIKTLHHAVICNIIFFNQIMQISHSLLESISILDINVSWHFQFNMH